MTEIAKVKDIMTREVLSVGPDDSLELVAQLFDKYDYDGIPVVGNDRKLLGIITAYDMIVQSSGMHLPTILNIMDKIAVN
ncbi:MAG: CBS domain-containing protein, partial [Candidatus Yanofskybacteria bacterium]|nr:CBS domain-containing protein [Candidatus Yanofskybacteria bacterium]